MKNREIKFRTWNGEKMIILNLFQCEHYEDEFVLRDSNDPDWVDDHCDEVKWPIMQFTGLHDKNGKEIYEGDIINASYFKLAICVWWNSGWYIKQYGNHFTFNTAKHTLEIIGNVYQHPELLK